MPSSQARLRFFPLCLICGHGGRPAGFAPLPWGRVPFCLQQQKGTKKYRPNHPADSCVSRPGRGLADASLRAANAGHPWPAPAGLIRPGLRCSGGMKGELTRLAGYAGIAQVGRSPTSREAKYPSRAPLSVAIGGVDWPWMANRGARHRKWLAPTLEGVTDSGDKRVLGSPFLGSVYWASKKWNSRRARLPQKKCGLIEARNRYHRDSLVNQLLELKLVGRFKRSGTGSSVATKSRLARPVSVFPSLPISWAWLASCGFRPPPVGGESLFVYSNKKGRKNAAPVIPLFLRFSARPGVG